MTRATHIGAVRTLYVPVQQQSVTRRRCIITQTSRRACRRGHDSLTAPAATSRSSSSYYYCCCPSYPVSSTRLPQNLRKTSLCSATTYADNVALPAFARRCCSNRSISPPAGPTAANLQRIFGCGPMLGHGTPGADRRTLCRSIYPALHIVRALSVNEIRLYAVYITFIYTQRWIIASDSGVAKVEQLCADWLKIQDWTMPLKLLFI